MPAVLRITRPLNLVFIAVTQFLLMYSLLDPVFTRSQNEPLLSAGWFTLLVLSTVLIAAAGYVINDYFDVKTDLINRPDRVVVGRQLSRRQAIALHLALNVTGVALGFILAFKVERPWLGGIHLLTAALLWFYSTNFKKRALSGNVIVSLLTAAVPVIVVLYQAPILESRLFDLLMFYGLTYGVFAFIVTMMRELVKDMQDIQGDAGDRHRTLPIVAGLKTTKLLVNIFGILAIALVGLLVWPTLPKHGMLLALYVLFLVQLPVVFVLAKLRPADRYADFRVLSYFIKGVMFTGILTMPLIPVVMHPVRLYNAMPFPLW